VFAGDDLDQQLPANGARRVIEAQQFALLPRLHFRRIVGMVEAQAFDRVAERPFDQFGAERAAELKVERARAGLFDRAADPKAMVGGAKQSFAAIFAIEQHAKARTSASDYCGSFHRQFLEGADSFARRADLVGDRLELGAMIDGQRHQAWRLLGASRCPVNMIERRIVAERPVRRAFFQKML
jgi:hypothetical protein